MTKYTYEYITGICDFNVSYFVEPRKRSEKVEIECNIHGKFEQAISSIIDGKKYRRIWDSGNKVYILK
jgi:hypothetical protein